MKEKELDLRKKELELVYLAAADRQAQAAQQQQTMMKAATAEQNLHGFNYEQEGMNFLSEVKPLISPSKYIELKIVSSEDRS